ncbi:MAG: hypothetical protein GWN00_37645 [Aliifodinibius sp.]|nr:hypothetical protein [Fodinibius sp.]NIY30305.1 hypothetical protein [Fodinibius sp.]
MAACLQQAGQAFPQVGLLNVKEHNNSNMSKYPTLLYGSSLIARIDSTQCALKILKKNSYGEAKHGEICPKHENLLFSPYIFA